MPYYGDPMPYYYGGAFSNHSSLMTGTPRSFHSALSTRFSPHLSTISESPLGGLRHYPTPGSSLMTRPKRVIDTADIDVSAPRYNNIARERNRAANNRLRRDRPTIRIRSQALKDNPALRQHNERHEKTVGELLVEKFFIKDKKNESESPPVRIYRQISLEDEPDSRNHRQNLQAVPRVATRRMTRRRSSADLQLDPEQLQRELTYALVQAEVLDNLVAEEQAEIEDEVRKGTLVKKATIRGRRSFAEPNEVEQALRLEEESAAASRMRKTMKKAKKKKKAIDKPSPTTSSVEDSYDGTSTASSDVDSSAREDNSSDRTVSNEDESPPIQMFKVEACNSVGDLTTVLINASPEIERRPSFDQFRESVKVTYKKPVLKKTKAKTKRIETIPEPTEIDAEIVLPVKKTYVKDTSRNSVYLTLKTIPDKPEEKSEPKLKTPETPKKDNLINKDEKKKDTNLVSKATPDKPEEKPEIKFKAPETSRKDNLINKDEKKKDTSLVLQTTPEKAEEKPEIKLKIPETPKKDNLLNKDEKKKDTNLVLKTTPDKPEEKSELKPKTPEIPKKDNLINKDEKKKDTSLALKTTPDKPEEKPEPKLKSPTTPKKENVTNKDEKKKTTHLTLKTISDKPEEKPEPKLKSPETPKIENSDNKGEKKKETIVKFLKKVTSPEPTKEETDNNLLARISEKEPEENLVKETIEKAAGKTIDVVAKSAIEPVGSDSRTTSAKVVGGVTLPVASLPKVSKINTDGNNAVEEPGLSLGVAAHLANANKNLSAGGDAKTLKSAERVLPALKKSSSRVDGPSETGVSESRRSVTFDERIPLTSSAVGSDRVATSKLADKGRKIESTLKKPLDEIEKTAKKVESADALGVTESHALSDKVDVGVAARVADNLKDDKSTQNSANANIANSTKVTSSLASKTGELGIDSKLKASDNEECKPPKALDKVKKAKINAKRANSPVSGLKEPIQPKLLKSSSADSAKIPGIEYKKLVKQSISVDEKSLINMPIKKTSNDGAKTVDASDSFESQSRAISHSSSSESIDFWSEIKPVKDSVKRKPDVHVEATVAGQAKEENKRKVEGPKIAGAPNVSSNISTIGDGKGPTKGAKPDEPKSENAEVSKPSDTERFGISNGLDVNQDQKKKKAKSKEPKAIDHTGTVIERKKRKPEPLAPAKFTEEVTSILQKTGLSFEGESSEAETPTPVAEKQTPLLDILDVPIQEDEDEGPSTPTNEWANSIGPNIAKWSNHLDLSRVEDSRGGEASSKASEATSVASSEATSVVTSVSTSAASSTVGSSVTSAASSAAPSAASSAAPSAAPSPQASKKKRVVKKKVSTTKKKKDSEKKGKLSSVKESKKETARGESSNSSTPKKHLSPCPSPKNQTGQRPIDLIKMFYTTPSLLLTATPRDLSKVKRAKIKRKKHPSRTPSVSSDSTGSTNSSTTTGSGSGTSTCTELEDDVEQKRLASIRSNDSGFDGSPRISNCDMACHKKCEKLTGNLCGLNQKLVAEALQALSKRAPSSSENQRNSDSSDHFASGRITPPATNLPRFKKYCVTDFNFLKVLGKGSFGKVLLAELRGTECVYAVKCLKKDVVLEDDDVECTLIERKVLTLATRHPYLCHLFCTFQTESHLFFVMEYLNGGDLMFHIQKSGRFAEPRARFYAAEIWSGLNFLHKKGIVYRDLKLDNVLLDFDGHIRIADFGMCKLQIFLDRTADTFCGTPDYMAPEIIKGLKYNQSVDWWAFGVLLYEMLTGQSPFSGCDEDELFWSICNERPFIPRYLSQEATDVLVCLLEKDSGKRLPGHEIAMHPFFQSLPWDRLERRQLEPPFKPALDHTLDTRYFDTAFTAERPRLTLVPEQILTSMDQGVFRGFSYTNPNATE